MKRKYIMMSILIEGPKQLGNDIDVYFQLLVDDLQTLWNTGVEVWDAEKREYFTLRAMLYNPRSSRSRQHLRSDCEGIQSVCYMHGEYHELKNYGKVVYMGHRRFLPF